MVGKQRQFNFRSGLALLLAMFMLIIAMTPALAWFDEGTQGKRSQGCRVISTSRGTQVICSRAR